MNIEQVEIQKVTIDEVLPLRQKVLWPDKPLHFSRVEGDDKAYHLAAVYHGEVIAVLSIFSEQQDCKPVARFRKFACKASYQRRGVGSRLLHEAIEFCRENHFAILYCHAREGAVDFYQRFGLHVVGSRFIKFSLPYFRMQLSLD